MKNENRIGAYEAAVREIRNKDKREGLKYWKDLLEGFDTGTEIPSFGEVPKEERCKVSELGIDIDADVTRRFTDLCKAEETTTGIGVQLAWGMVLSTYSRSEDIVFAKVVSGRDNTTEDVNRTIGLFINTVPVRMTINEKSTGRQALKMLQEQSVRSSEYDYCSLSEIQAQSELGNRLFQTVLTFQNYGSGSTKESEAPQKKRSFRIKSAVLKEETFDDLTPVAFMNGERLHLNLRFDNKKYRESEIKSILTLFATFVRGIGSEPDRALVTLDRLNDDQRLDVMRMSTGQTLLYNTDQTWIDMFLSLVRMQPDHTAVADEGGELTYLELDRLSDSVAQYLLQQAVKPNEFVVIRMNRCKEFAAAVIGIHKVGACYVPIDPDYPEDRIAFMESDCEAKLVLSKELVLECAKFFPEPSPVHLTDPENLAYMIYTSGSTGRPKGAMIPQSALMNYTQIYIRRFGVTPKDRLSHHITFSFDSHIRDFYPALAAGASLHFMSDSIVKDPALICKFLIDNCITGAAFATAMGQLLLTEYDLKLRFISVGGEALRGVTGSGIHVFNVCGATEVTDVVLDYELEKGRFYESVPIGKPLENCYAFIFDSHGNLLPKGIPGEICYVGRNVGCGYWKRDDLTKAAFTDCPIFPGQTMYRTRDLGRYNDEGDVEYMGRLDFQVKLRGFRIELGEVESNAIKYPGIRQVVAAVSDDHLCLYYTADEIIEPDRIRDYLAGSLAEYMVPDAFMQLDEMPLTPSGKIDKKNLPKMEKAAEEIIPPESSLEQELFELISGQLHYDAFGVTSNLISQGMSSLGIMRLSGIIQTRYKTFVSVADLMREPFIRSIAGKIEGKQSKEDVRELRIHNYDAQEVYPATENQIGVYLDWEMNRDTTQYNIPMAFCLTDVDTERFAGAVQKTLSAHPYMNSSFEIRDGKVVQIPVQVDTLPVHVTELKEEPGKEFFQSLVRPFDLNRDILYRIELYTWQGQTWMFMDVHHIIFDGLSESIFMSDVLKAYEGELLTPEKVTAYDFALYEKELQEDGAYDEAGKYFKELLSDSNVMSYPNSAVPDGTKQGVVSIEIDAAVIDRAGQKFEVTAGSFIHAAFGETMSRIQREECPVYLTISNGRTGLPELEESVGMFVKTVPVVYRRKKDGKLIEKVADYVHSVSEQLGNTYRREIYPYTKLVEDTGLHGEILFVYQGGMYEGGEVEGARVIELDLDTLKFPLTVTAYPVKDCYQIRFEYDGERYCEKDIKLLAFALKQVIMDMAYVQSLADVRLVDKEEEKKIIEASMGRDLTFDTTRTWLDFFAETVQEYPDKPALEDEDRTLTYTQLDQESDAVASYLLDREIRENSFVALCMDRCAEFVVAVVGIHKAGAAYLPIDMNYPVERRRYMLEDSEADVVMTRETVVEAVRSHHHASSQRRADPDGYAYMIYTSGSTGRPKGTILHHRGLLNFTIATLKENGLTNKDRIGHHFSFSFDSHIEDLYPPLLAGASIHIMPEAVRRDPDLIFRFLTEHRITGGGFTTSVGRLMAANYKLPQRYVALMGEALTQITPGETTIINKYGPTECTNIVATYVLEKGRNYREVPIGRPMPGGAVFLVDTRMKLVPYGCIGELCYAGPQVGYGYWKLEDKTKEVFVDCPWMEGMKLYRTGDLARYGSDGQLEYLGRMDHQVKVNGFRVEFGEIESTALRYAGVYQAAAAVRQGRIILYYTEKNDCRISEEDLRSHMSGNLADYMMPQVFVRLSKMPSTPSGKVDRKALPEPEFLRSVPYAAPVTKTQKKITQSLRKILGISEDIGINDNFFELGGDSIKAIRLVSLLRDESITVSVADIIKGKTAAAIAERAGKAESRTQLSQEPIEGTVELSPIMHYFNELKLPMPQHFNQSVCLECREQPDPELLQKCLDTLTYQHDMLRTVIKDGNPVILGTGQSIRIETIECGSIEEMAEYCNKLQSGIDMEKALMRACLFHVNKSRYLVLIAHHLIIDGVSWRIILSDLETAYAQCLEGKNPILPEKTSTYRDYVDNMKSFAQSYALSLEIPYWKSVQDSMLRYPVSIETDYSRSMERLGKTLDREKSLRLLRADYGKLCAEIDDALLTAVSRSYARIWNTDGVSFQFEGHGREDIGGNTVIDRTVGWFTSIYPMVVEHLSGDLKKDFIRVKETRHRVPGKGVGYNALRYLEEAEEFAGLRERCARIGFNYLGEMDAEHDSDSFFRMSDSVGSGNPIAPENVFGPDLSINAAVTGGCLSVGLTYNTAICSEEMAGKFIDGIFEELDLICGLLDGMTVTEKSATDFGEFSWTTEEFEAVQSDFGSRGQEIVRIYPLTPMQESMLLKHMTDPESMAYRLGYVFELDTLLDREVAERAVTRLEQKYEVLRTAFIYEGVSVPRQAIINRRAQVEIRDISDGQDPAEAAKELREELLGGVHDLQRQPNFRVVIAKKNDSSCYLYILVHHMLVDGWCNSLYMGDLYRFLLEEMGYEVPDSEKPEPANGLYEKVVRDLLSRDRRKALSYWEELLRDYETNAVIPSYGTVPADERCGEDTLSVAVDSRTTEKLLELCRQQQTTVSNAVELLWGLVLQTYSRSKDVVFAKVVSGRDYTENADKVVGLFINSVPVRVMVDNTATARQMLGRLREQATASAEWDFCPLVDIQKRTAAGSDLVQSVLAFENYTSGLKEMGAGQAPGNSPLPFVMHPFVIKEEVFGRVDPLTYIDDDGQLILKLAFDRSAFTKMQIQTVLSLFENFAKEIAADPDSPVVLLRRTGKEEAASVLKISCGGSLPMDSSKTWLDLFGESVRSFGSSVAVTDDCGSISYEELDRESDAVASYLLEQHVARGSFVAVRMGRVREYVTAILGVQKAGAAFVPVDPDLPKERIDFILKDAACSLLLDSDTLKTAVKQESTKVSFPDITPTDPAYMIYTSGSTGEPKGVVQSHRSLFAFVSWRCRQLKVDHTGRHGQYISFSFDASLDDLICPICVGGQVFIMDEDVRNDLDAMERYIRNNRITSMALPAQIGMAFINAHPDTTLKTLVMGGESLRPVCRTAVRLINEYGPTEFTVCSSYHEVDPEKDKEIPIGRPVPGTASLILDEEGNLLPLGIVGELCLSGAQIAEGYWNRPELTKEKFALLDINGEEKRVYRTGDLARYNEDGELVYHGRADRQLKIRGFRVEPGEIESCAARFEGVLSAAADVKDGRLALYYVSRKDVNEAELGAFLKEFLADYMVPAVYMRIPRMPLSSNGKIDYKNLPEITSVSGEDFAAPVGTVEKTIAETVRDFLGLDIPVSATDDFFVLGGDSIKVIRLVSALRRAGIELKAADVMKARTVRAMAKIAEGISDTAGSSISQEAYSGKIKNAAITGFFESLQLPVPGHFNQTLLLKISDNADSKALTLAWDALTEHHDMLRAVRTDDGLFVREESVRIPVEEYTVASSDFTNICNSIQGGIKMDQALVRAAIIHMGSEDLFFVAAHHLVIDSVSWSIIAADLETAYGDAVNGRKISLPDKTNTYRDYVNEQYEYRNSYALTREIPYWNQVEARLSALCKNRTIINPGRIFGYLGEALEEEETLSFVQSGFGKDTVELGEALLSAVCRSYFAMTDERDISVQFEGHGRQNPGMKVVLDRTVGWFTAAYPVVFENAATADLEQDLICVRETLRRVPNSGVGYMTLKYLPGKKNLAANRDVVPQIGFNYLGETDTDQNHSGYFRIAEGLDTGLSMDERNTFGPDLSLNIMISGKRLIMAAGYSRDSYKESQIREFLSDMHKNLMEIGRFIREHKAPFTILPSDLGETQWTLDEFRKVEREFAGRGERISRVYPLLPLQQGMLLAHTKDPKAWGYRLVSIYELNRLPSGQQMREALKKLSKRHEVFRTAIVYKNVSVPRQVICDRELSLTEIDLCDATDKVAAIKRVREDILTNGFDLQDRPLFQVVLARTSNSSCYLVTAVHHMIVDGWCIKDYMTDFFGLIGEAITGNELLAPSEDLPGSYEAAVREILGKDKDSALDYFGVLLSDYQTKAEIQSYGNVPESEQSDTDDIRVVIDRDTTDELISLCRSEQATLSQAAEMIWGMVLQTYNHTGDVVFTKVVSGRDLEVPGAEHIVGMFINSVPVRVRAEKDTTVRQLLRAMQRQGADTAAFDFCPLDEILAGCELGSNLYQSVFSFENFDSGVVADNVEEKEAAAGGMSPKELYNREENYTDIHPYAFQNAKGEFVYAISFDRTKYRKTEIQRILSLVKILVSGMIKNPDTAVFELPRLSDEDAEAMMRLSRGMDLSYNTDETWMDRFLRLVATQPDHLAVTDDVSSLTYRELDRASDAVANRLLEMGVKPDEFVVIKLHRVKEFAVAVIGIHKVGACYVPIDPDYPKDRIEYMEKDCEARVVLTRELVKEWAEKDPEPKPVHLTRPEQLAYMIYTSGSTGLPKGAMIPQSALMNYTEIYIRRFGITPVDRVSHHITFSFDSHIRDFYPALAGGASLHFMPDRICKDPEEIYDFLIANRITVSAFATAMGRLLISGYDLKQRVVSVGGEALRDVTGSDVRIINICGATEVTDIVLDYELEKGRYYDSVPLGRPLENCYAFIMDEAGNLLPQGVPGEICYVGRNVGNGYWNRDELTAAVFTDCPVLPGQIMYHTRDLGRYNEEGNVEYLGRLDFQVKLRGYRIELGEVESNALRFDDMKQVVADVRDGQLVLYFVADRKVDRQELKAFLSKSLTDYMVPTVYIQLDAMPMTPSGKFDRKKLPAPGKAVDEIVMPSDELEEKLRQMIGGIIHFDGFGVTNNLVSLGLNSLGIMRLSGLIQTGFKANVRVADMMREPTIRSIAGMIRNQREERENEKLRIHAYDRREVYPITENQRGVFLDCQMHPNTTQYNVPSAFGLKDTDPDRLCKAIKDAVAAHPYLNTGFMIRDGEIWQLRRDDLEAEVEVTTLEEEPTDEFFQSLVRPFALLKDVLYRFHIYAHAGTTWVFMDIHHIIYDGLSSAVFMDDIQKAYFGQSISRENVTAFDFALYEKELALKEDYQEAEKYFEGLVEEANALSIPDSQEPDGSVYGRSELHIPAQTVDRMTEKFRVTAGSLLQAAFGETLMRLTREKKLLYLTISSGRSDIAELEHTVGMFIKTLPVVREDYFDTDENLTVQDYVRAVHRQLNESISREFYPYTRLVERFGIRGEILFIYQGSLYEGGEVENARMIRLQLDETKLPLYVTAYPAGDEYVVSIEYDGRKYSKRDMDRITHAMGNVMESMAGETYLKDVSTLNEEETREIIRLSAGEKLKVDEARTWVDVFAQRVENYKERIAVTDDSGSLTYSDLDEASDAIAAYLSEIGVKPNDFVALEMDRVKEFVVAVLGIHKAGAAYVPIDLNYPAERKKYMLDNSCAALVLKEEDVRRLISDFRGRSLPRNLAVPDGYAYMIYTSGSTGKPKGAVLHHRGLLNFTMASIKQNRLTKDDRIGLHFSFSFDSHIEDIYPVLLSGASIHIMPERIRRDPDRIVSFLNEHKITGGGYTTSVARLLVQNYKFSVRYITAIGEALTEVTQPEGLQIINKYGPTECTNVVSLYYLEQGRNYASVPIGRAMPNGYAFILDKRGQPVSAGTPGELCYAGPQVGYGYWQQDDRTKEVFGNCPLVDNMRMYHTGDLAGYDRDGNLEYLGRIDFQVKVNGYRIELGEIENCVLKLPKIRQCACVVRNGQIILYYTLKEKISEEEIRKALEKSLAQYMVPSVFMQLDAMPQTPSGKIDKKAMPEPVGGDKSFKNEMPSTPEEEEALKILRSLIPGVAFGVTDDLFDIGMNSLIAMKLAARLNRKTGKNYRMGRLLSQRTIRGFLEKDAEICRYHREYDPSKPVLVVPSGNTTLVGTEHLYRSWDQRFNVLIIEPLAVHYEKLLKEKSFDEVVSYYHNLIEDNIPDGATLFGFIGFSFGGEIAYHLACKWEKIHGEEPMVIMGDTFLKRTIPKDQVEQLTKESFDSSLERFMASEGLTMDEILYMANLMRRLDATYKNLVHYPGPVIFINAQKNNSEEQLAEKLKLLNEIKPDAKIIDLPDHDHGSIFLSSELEELYISLFQR